MSNLVTNIDSVHITLCFEEVECQSVTWKQIKTWPGLYLNTNKNIYIFWGGESRCYPDIIRPHYHSQIGELLLNLLFIRKNMSPRNQRTPFASV